MRNARAKSSAKLQETKLSMKCTKEITNGTLLKKAKLRDAQCNRVLLILAASKAN